MTTAIRTHRHLKLKQITRPGWVFPRALLDFDFVNNRQFGATKGGFRGSGLVCTRSSIADYMDDVQGTWRTFSANTPRISNKGLLIEGTGTNILLWCRDLTNAAWVRVGATAALDQIGIDGTANSATSITATGANGTVLQTVTLASSTRVASVFVKRLTGSGVINMTLDGLTYTAITVTSTTAWTRVSIPSQAAVTNPITGFQIVTSGDSIAVDFVQNEVGPNVTSPVLTTVASASHNADVVSYADVPPFLNLGCTIFAQAVPMAAAAFASNQSVLAISDGTTNNRIIVYRAATTSNEISLVTAGGSIQLNNVSGGAWTIGARGKGACMYEPANNVGVFNAQAGSSSTTNTATMAALTSLQIGQNGALGGQLFGYIERIAIFPRRNITQMRDLTL